MASNKTNGDRLSGATTKRAKEKDCFSPRSIQEFKESDRRRDELRTKLEGDELMIQIHTVLLNLYKNRDQLHTMDAEELIEKYHQPEKTVETGTDNSSSDTLAEDVEEEDLPTVQENFRKLLERTGILDTLTHSLYQYTRKRRPYSTYKASSSSTCSLSSISTRLLSLDNLAIKNNCNFTTSPDISRRLQTSPDIGNRYQPLDYEQLMGFFIRLNSECVRLRKAQSRLTDKIIVCKKAKQMLESLPRGTSVNKRKIYRQRVNNRTLELAHYRETKVEPMKSFNPLRREIFCHLSGQYCLHLSTEISSIFDKGSLNAIDAVWIAKRNKYLHEQAQMLVESIAAADLYETIKSYHRAVMENNYWLLCQAISGEKEENVEPYIIVLQLPDVIHALQLNGCG